MDGHRGQSRKRVSGINGRKRYKDNVVQRKKKIKGRKDSEDRWIK